MKSAKAISNPLSLLVSDSDVNSGGGFIRPTGGPHPFSFYPPRPVPDSVAVPPTNDDAAVTPSRRLTELKITR